MPDAAGEANLNETLNLQLEETKAHGRIPSLNDVANSETAADIPANAETVNAASDEEESKGGWNLFKRGKPAPTKNREMTRRR
jgi:hypothetical protein